METAWVVLYMYNCIESVRCGRGQVRKILWKLFELAPTPESGATVDTAQVEEIIKPLGLFRKRALMFKRFSQEYLETNVRLFSYTHTVVQIDGMRADCVWGWF